MTGSLEKFRAHLLKDGEDVKEELLFELLEDAKSKILLFTGRQILPRELENTQVRLAVILYNRLGLEGEIQRGEGDIHMTLSPFPEDIKSELLPFRLVRTGGR